ncbi:MAG: hypothetical protein Q8J64_06470 [Thermodesulfovibrionales bacterium]|nr:hypothetical protein [Thermodesulfovibrionales bacterium]
MYLVRGTMGGTVGALWGTIGALEVGVICSAPKVKPSFLKGKAGVRGTWHLGAGLFTLLKSGKAGLRPVDREKKDLSLALVRKEERLKEGLRARVCVKAVASLYRVFSFMWLGADGKKRNVSKFLTAGCYRKCGKGSLGSKGIKGLEGIGFMNSAVRIETDRVLGCLRTGQGTPPLKNMGGFERFVPLSPSIIWSIFQGVFEAFKGSFGSLRLFEKWGGRGEC